MLITISVATACIWLSLLFCSFLKVCVGVYTLAVFFGGVGGWCVQGACAFKGCVVKCDCICFLFMSGCYYFYDLCTDVYISLVLNNFVVCFLKSFCLLCLHNVFFICKL